MILGDITHSLSKLVHTLKLFKLKFKDVYYCPGNHELWTESDKEAAELNIHNSIEKFHYVENNDKIIFCIHFIFLDNESL